MTIPIWLFWLMLVGDILGACVLIFVVKSLSGFMGYRS